jgi:hypothetical protein
MSSSVGKKPVYLRGIPADLVREAKAVAARRGITLAGFVADTLASAVKQQGPGITRADELGSEMRWYQRNRERLVRELDGEYVAIVGNRVIDHDEHFEALAERVFARDSTLEVFMPRVSADPRAIRVRSPRVGRR